MRAATALPPRVRGSGGGGSADVLRVRRALVCESFAWIPSHVRAPYATLRSCVPHVDRRPRGERRLAVYLFDETTRYLTREIPATNGLKRLLVFRPK